MFHIFTFYGTIKVSEKEVKIVAANAKDIQFNELKDSISQLNITIRNQSKLIETLQKTLEEYHTKEAHKDQTIANLQAELAYLRQKLFGSSSERRIDYFPGQLELFSDPEDNSVPELIEPEIINVTAYTKERKKKPTLEEQFKDLPTRQVKVATLTDDEKICPACGTEMVPIGTEVIRTEVIFTPAKLERVEYLATTYQCTVCKDTEDPQFIKDEGVKALIPHSYASSSLVSHVVYAKFMNALPFYRQEKDFEQLGATISRAAMAHWTIYCAFHYLKPIYDYCHRKLIERRFLMADETPVQVLKEEGRRAQTKSYIWLVRSGEDGLPTIILYNYTPTRAGENVATFLKGIKAGYYLMADGYNGYNKVKDINRCVCFAHIRRYLIEAIPKGHEKDYSYPAVQGVLYCDKLFEYERTYKAKDLSYKQRYNRRLKDEKPIIEAFLSWVDAQKPSKGSRLDRAIIYINNRRDNLMTYLEDGHCSLSNNLSENSIRPVTVGRKNWLFSDSTDGAEASMICYSIIEMAKAQNLNIYKYLTYLLEKRPNTNMKDDEIEKLLPWNESIQELCGKKLK